MSTPELTHETDNPADPAFQAWCIAQYARMAEGGVWAVPRSGLIFRKQGARRLELIEEMPWIPEMEGTITREELREYQDAEFELIRRHFAAVDIEVVKAEGDNDGETST